MNTFLTELKKQGDLQGFDTRKIAQADREYITPGMTEEQRRELRERYSQEHLARMRAAIDYTRNKMGDMGI